MLTLGVRSIVVAWQDAERRSIGDARRAAEACAAELRSVLLAAPLDLAEPSERFAIAAGELVVDARVGSREASPEEPALELSGQVRASLDELEVDQGAAARLELLIPSLGPKARGAVRLALAWQAHRTGDGRRCAQLVDGVLTDLAQAAALRQTAAGLAVLQASRGEAVPGEALATVARGTSGENRALVERLAELGATAAAEELATRHAAVVEERATLRVAASLVGALVAAAPERPLVLGVGETLLLYRADAAGEGRGAVVPPFEFTARLRASPLLKAPWSGTVRAGSTNPAAIDIVPGLLALEPEHRPVDRAALLGLLLVLLACAIAFAGGLLAVRRGIVREREAMRVRSEFLTTVTHELRTPIAALRLLAERLVEGQVKDHDRRAEYHAMLASEATRLSALVENVLDLGRMERGERSYDRRRVPVRELVADAARVVATLARAKGLRFAVDDRSGDAELDADRNAIQQALLNLCDNAQKYGASGTGETDSGESGGELSLEALADGGWIHLRVRDRGPGVPDDERERIFERFVRGRAHAHGGVPGAGLGLHLARAIARAHGGELACEPRTDGPGACFRLSLPRAPADEARST